MDEILVLTLMRREPPELVLARRASSPFCCPLPNADDRVEDGFELGFGATALAFWTAVIAGARLVGPATLEVRKPPGASAVPEILARLDTRVCANVAAVGMKIELMRGKKGSRGFRAASRVVGPCPAVAVLPTCPSRGPSFAEDSPVQAMTMSVKRFILAWVMT